MKNQQKLAGVSRKTQENARNSQAENIFGPGMTRECITQVSDQIESRVTEKLSQDFSRTESRILGALSKLDELHLNSQLRTCTGTVQGTSRCNVFENREPTGDRSQNDFIPKRSFLFVRPAIQVYQTRKRPLTKSEDKQEDKFPVCRWADRDLCSSFVSFFQLRGYSSIWLDFSQVNFLR